MKRFMILCAVILTLLTMTACGNDNTVTDVPGSTDAETTAEALTTESLTVTITFPEGFTAIQIAEELEKNNVCSAADFMSLIQGDYASALPYSFIKEIPNPEERPYLLEGYIFPDTYEFYKEEGAGEALTRFLDNTEEKLTAEYKKRAEEIGYTMDEILCLASIIQEEASDVKEMDKVSSVIHNRIESDDYGMLQCDVTINYLNDCVIGSPYFSGDADTFTELYNTYKCYGLPAGPICNVGINAIEAALYPADTDYFFFVTDEQWNYYYAETYEEHQENCYNVGIEG